ncbi:MAG: prepilin-type N-terminal cleavage/methylation domain-containing protein [Verrucomicrobia bacterium]|nr:prepilin-type N-terminal cleavage/methylation domain-containing protein [Verrucomicrobiota bacterium]
MRGPERPSSQRGFTLIELLVVIALISTLEVAPKSRGTRIDLLAVPKAEKLERDRMPR